MNMKNWIFNESKFPQSGNVSELATIFEQIRETAQKNFLTVAEYGVIHNENQTTFSCQWKNGEIYLTITVIFSGAWHYGMPIILTQYFFGGSFNGNEGFGKIQKWNMRELKVVLSGNAEGNTWAKLIYFLEEKISGT
jgi:hypothetical protein